MRVTNGQYWRRYRSYHIRQRALVLALLGAAFFVAGYCFITADLVAREINPIVYTDPLLDFAADYGGANDRRCRLHASMNIASAVPKPAKSAITCWPTSTGKSR